MAIFKFYNVQLLPMDTSKVKEVGAEGYCKLFAALSQQILEMREKKRKLGSIAVSMRGEMYFAPFSVTEKEFASDDPEKPNRFIHGYFLKFDDVNELVDTDSGELEYKSSGNTSSRRYKLEFVFDPQKHVLAIQHAQGLPARNPLIDALDRLFDGHAHRLFPEHSLEIEELTSADSISDFLSKPKKGIKRYTGYITFSNSDKFSEEMERAELEAMKAKEQELKDKNVAQWTEEYKGFKGHLMSDLPDSAKLQMKLATRYGNATAVYKDLDGSEQKYQMDDYPVREPLKEEPEGILDRGLAILKLIGVALGKTRKAKDISVQNKAHLNSKDE